MKQLKVIISGGGTGGHIFPALAIAGKIKQRFPGSDILFVGAIGRMEMEKVPAMGYKIIGLPVMGLPRKPGIKIVKFLVNLLKSNCKAKQVIRDFKPDVAIGVGGFASGPLLRMATRMKIPSLIQEQNSYAGITNKLLAKKVNKICVAYDNMDRYFPKDKIILTGNPVREDLIIAANGKEPAVSFFGLSAGKKVILIIGGSLGAKSINEAVLKNLEGIRHSGIEIIWQTGSLYYERIIREIEGNQPENLHIKQFITRMDLAYAAADIVISRAGAGTISELCILGKPMMLIPSPNVAEDHQTRNAMALAGNDAAIMIPDDGIDQNLFNQAFSLINDDERLKTLSANSLRLAKPKAAEMIVDEIEKLLKIND